MVQLLLACYYLEGEVILSLFYFNKLIRESDYFKKYERDYLKPIFDFLLSESECLKGNHLCFGRNELIIKW